MLPYQLVAQREAMMIAAQPGQPNQPQSSIRTQNSDKSHQNVYTDSSLQYMDDSEFDDASLQRLTAGPRETASNANSASYGSRNEARTLPMPP